MLYLNVCELRWANIFYSPPKFSPKVNQNHKSQVSSSALIIRFKICKLVMPIFIFICLSIVFNEQKSKRLENLVLTPPRCDWFIYIFGCCIQYVFHPDSREERWWPIIWLSIVLGHKFYKSFKPYLTPVKSKSEIPTVNLSII